jgi:hypothetical protein
MPSDAQVKAWIDAVDRFPEVDLPGADEAFERR